ncbi:HAD hydrolase-like protein [Streptacidiphilus sp. 4-A2]|nr:HAD hydrolase-like protein [Streptacidiphilus sp. 4-A2]
MPLIVLWDIDHTLIENSGVSKEIYAAAFAALTGRPPSVPVVTEGRTDRLIMADLFHRHQASPPVWDEIEQALAEAGAARESDLRQRGYVLPGAREALEALSGEPVVTSVLTGNIVANAQVKLRAFGLDGLVDLAVGAYGADCEDRSGLVPMARQRIRAAYSALPVSAPVLLVGDTPRDVQAALANGAEVLAVASGSYDMTALHAAGARIVLPDLRDTARVMAALRELEHTRTEA